MSTTSKALILGAGYLGQRLILPLKNEGFLVDTVTRNSQIKSEHLHQSFNTDSTDLTTILKISRPDLLVICWAPGSRTGQPSNYANTYWESLLNLKEALKSYHCPQQIIYTSSTSVYSDQDGSIKNGTEVLAPTNERNEVLLKAESEILSWQKEFSITTQVLRCSGIFGPDRWPGLRLLNSNKPIPGNSNAWVNLVHVDDIVQAILLCFNHKISKLWNLSSMTIKRQELYAKIAESHQLSPPEWESEPSNLIGRQINADQAKHDLNWAPKVTHF